MVKENHFLYRFYFKKNSLALLRHKADHRRDAVGRVALRSSDQCVQLPG